MGGRIAVPFHSGYHGTKFAVEGLSESVKYGLEPFGIKTILIEPGAVVVFEVAKAILQAVTSDNPDLRYVVGKDAAMALESRRNMSDKEFHDSIKKQINLENVTS